MNILKVTGQRRSRDERLRMAQIADATPKHGAVRCYLPTNPHEIVRAFLDEHQRDDHKILTLRHWQGDFFIYTGSRYVRVSKSDMVLGLTEYARRHFDVKGITDSKGRTPSVTEALIRNAMQAVASRVHVSDHDEQPKWLSEHDHGPHLAFANGLVPTAELQAGTAKATPHSPEWFSQVCFDYEFDASASCEGWLTFLREVFEDDAERIALLQEFMGLSLMFDMQFQRFLVMIGAAGAGKSVIADVWTALVGPDHVSNVPLERFGDRFALHGTRGKLVNFSHEPGPLLPAAENVLKAVTGQDRLTIEQKFKDPFQAYMTIRVVVLTNNLPNFTDRSGGIWRRALFLPFYVSVPAERQDKHLAEKLKRELPGIFNWAWRGYRRLLEQGEFTEPAASRTAAQEFLKDANPAREFFEQCCVEEATGSIPVQQLYQTYRTWAEDRGHRPLDERQFGLEVRRTFPGVVKQRKGPRQDRAYTYTGLAFTLDR